MTVYGGTTSTYYYVKDHLGSIQAIVDSSGSIVESYQYDAWGNVLNVFDSSGNPIENRQSQIGNRYLWQGREYSWATRLYYFRARYYDSETGRWLSNDPIGISGGLNQYVFCRNNPVNFRDPTGLCWKRIKEWWNNFWEWVKMFAPYALGETGTALHALEAGVGIGKMIPDVNAHKAEIEAARREISGN